MIAPTGVPDATKTGVTTDLKAAGFFLRLAAMMYDSLLLIATLFVATAAILPLNNGEAFAADNYFYLAYLVFVSFLFYGWFWTHGSQTLGLRTWKLRVLTLERQPLNWKQALLRYLAAILSWAIFGLGFLWIFVDKNNQSWHDLLSKTTVYVDNRH